MIADTQPGTWNRRGVVRSPALRTRARTRWKALAERRALAGLTTRGTVPRRRLENRLLLADVDALALAIAETFEQLTPKAQAAAMMLEIKLAAARKQLI